MVPWDRRLEDQRGLERSRLNEFLVSHDVKGMTQVTYSYATQTSNFAVVQDSAGGRQASLVPATLRILRQRSGGMHD